MSLSVTSFLSYRKKIRRVQNLSLRGVCVNVSKNATFNTTKCYCLSTRHHGEQRKPDFGTSSDRPQQPSPNHYIQTRPLRHPPLFRRNKNMPHRPALSSLSTNIIASDEPNQSWHPPMFSPKQNVAGAAQCDGCGLSSSITGPAARLTNDTGAGAIRHRGGVGQSCTRPQFSGAGVAWTTASQRQRGGERRTGK